MKRPLKVILWVLGSIVLLVIGAAVIIALTFDANKYKTEIAAAVGKATGRQLTIEGDIDLSFFPWLGAELGAMQLSNAPGFGDEPFARIRAAAIKVKLLPLLRKEVEADVVTLDGLQVQLLRNADGRNNWQDLAGAKKESEAARESTDPTPALAGFALGGVNLRDASIVWDDRAAATHYELRKLNLDTGAVIPGAPITLSTNFEIISAAPALNGRVQLATHARYDTENQRLDLNDIALDAQLQTPALSHADVKLSAHAVLDIAQQHYLARDVTVNAQLRGANLPGKQIDATFVAQIDANLKENRLTVEPLTITAPGLKASGAVHGRDIATAPQFNGQLNIASANVRELMQGLGITPPNTADTNVLKDASARLTFNATRQDAELTQLTIKLDQTIVSGSAAIQHFSKPAIRFQLAADNIDADRYLPPPTNAAPPAAAAAASAAAAPPAGLRALSVDGTLKIGKLKIKKVKLNDIEVNLKAKDGLIAARPLRAQLYGGSYRGDLQIDARNETLKISTDDVLSKVAVGPLVQDFLEKDIVAGNGNINVQVSTAGTGAEYMRRNLNGKFGFSFTEGRLNGVNLIEMLQKDYLKRIQSMVGDDSKLNQTVFSKFAATATINNGVISTDDLTLVSAQLNVKGRGTIDLIDERIDLRLDAVPSGQFAKQLGDFSDVVVPVKVKGTLTAPTYTVDLGDALKQKAKARFDAEKQKLERKLQHEVDKQKQDAQQKLQQEQKKLEEKVQQQLQNKLKGLFQ